MCFFWGILGVIALRAIMIALGATLVSQFSWVRYILGIFLVFTGIKMWVIADHVPDIGNDPILVTQTAPARDQGIARQCQRPTKSTT